MKSTEAQITVLTSSMAKLDEETGWYYYGARYYDPRTSVWLSVDPLMEQTMQPYQYTYQNPIRYIDPAGMSGEDPPIKTCGTCGRKESEEQKKYRLKYQEIAETANVLLAGGLSREKSDNEVDAYSLFYQWTMGTGKSERNFDENSKMGKEFLKIDEVQDGISDLIDNYIDTGARSGQIFRNNPAKFNTGSQWLDDKAYMADALSTILSNPTSTFQGSFSGKGKIANIDLGYFYDTYTVVVNVTDYMGLESGTRDRPVNGKYTGGSTMPNNFYGTNGYMRTITINYNITTTVNRPAIKRQLSNLFK